MRTVAYRLRFPVVQTAVIEMYNPSTDVAITLFGMLHQADAGYFRRMEDKVNALTDGGTTVLQEAFTVDTASVNPDILARWNDILSQPELQNGYGGQIYHFSPRNTEPCDLPLSGDTRQTRKILRMLMESTQDAEKPQTQARKLLNALILEWLSPAMEFFLSTYHFLVRDRNNHVLSVVDARQAEKPQDMGIVFGAAHMNGFVRGLRRRGYKTRNIEWLTAHTI